MSTSTLTPAMVVASTMEQALTLIGVGIPASMPVYRAWYKACMGDQRRPSVVEGDSQIAQLTIGGHHMPGSKPKPQQRVPSLWDIHKAMAVSDPELGLHTATPRCSSGILRDDERTLFAREEVEAATQSVHAPRPASLHIKLGRESPPEGD
ncbi:hypothetical protein BD289DRAFT_30453 [Coniella lustricola]|uniref:Uncharacterized protein n=1 Tax=Coniella lustricola TaxID=2025994 RepID=A0A2T3A320_9PEZI|nr:hypothetical protein BD289DRAFT_30453 [Coniella lustricola]